MVTRVKINPEYIPTFQNKDFVILTKDCESFSTRPAFVSKFFKKGRLCRVIKCGLSHFFVDKKNQPLELVEHCQWCTVSAIIEEEKYLFGYSEGLVGGIVKANDLRERTVNDIKEDIFP